MHAQPSWLAALGAWFPAQTFQRESKTAEEAKTDRVDVLVRLILVFPVFAVNVSFFVTLAVTS